jgi:hypothetical protein
MVVICKTFAAVNAEVFLARGELYTSYFTLGPQEPDVTGLGAR